MGLPTYNLKTQKWTDANWGFAEGLRREGQTYTQIADRLNCCSKTVTRQLKAGLPSGRLLRGRGATAEQAARRKALQKIVKETFTTRGKEGVRKVKVRVIVHQKYPSVRTQGRRLRELGFKQTSRETVRGDLKALGYKNFRRPKVPFLDANDRKARVEFGQEWKSKDTSKWLFSDECYFNVGDHGVPTQWATSRSKVRPRGRRQGGPKVMVWGLIGFGMRQLIIFPETKKGADDVVRGMDSRKYVRMCLSKSMKFLKKPGIRFQQDGARVHTCKHTSRYLAGKKVNYEQKWPAHSPDLNPIENVWAILKRRVSSRGPFAREELVRYIKEEFEAIPQQLIDNCVLSFKRRLKEVVKNRGYTVLA